MKKVPLRRKTALKRSQKALKRTALSPVSKKQQKKLREYSKLRKEYLEEHPLCECGCGRKSRDIHHKAGRGSNLNRVETWMAVCRPCHDEIHACPSVARKRGWIK